jgi:glycerate-2-kinase
MKMKAKKLGYLPKVMSYRQKGTPKMAALVSTHTLLKMENTPYNVILIGGETTPILPEKHGKGGRNQHYAAVSMTAMRLYPGNWTLVSAATDGSDYMPNIAGAVVDDKSLSMAKSKGIDVQSYIDQYDSYHLFKEMGFSLLKTSHTGTNVGDIIIYILE